MLKAYPDRAVPTPILDDLVKAGRLGRSRAPGSASSTARGKPEADPAVDADPGEAPDGRPRARPTPRSPTGCSCRCSWRRPASWRRGSSASPADVDMGLILGIGFPPFRGGILRWADTDGAGEILERLEQVRSRSASGSSRPRR